MVEDLMLSLVAVAVVFIILVGIKIYDEWTFVRHMVSTIENRVSVRRGGDDSQQDSR
jgi:hypothetical protein